MPTYSHTSTTAFSRIVGAANAPTPTLRVKGTSPYLVYIAYLATVLAFEFFISSLLLDEGLSSYRSEKISILLAAVFLIATQKFHLNQSQPNYSLSRPDARRMQQALLFSVPLCISGIALIGMQVFLTAQLSEVQAAALWNFTGVPGEIGFYDKYFGSNSGLINLLLFASTQFVLLPLAEEIYFKGIILENLLSKHSIAVSILIVSTLFTIAHDHNQFIATFVFSALTCLYYIRCRNIWILVSIHGLGNLYFWLYQGFGGLTFLEAKRIDELGQLSTWAADLSIAALSSAACIFLLIRTSSKAPPSPSPASSSPDPDPT